MAEAREIVRGFKKDIFAGKDPKMKKAVPDEISFKKVAEEFFCDKEKEFVCWVYTKAATTDGAVCLSDDSK